MHARNDLQSIINGPNHDLALQINMNHARMNSRTATRRWMSYLSLVELGVRELKYANTLQFFKIHKLNQQKHFSPSLTLSMVGNEGGNG